MTGTVSTVLVMGPRGSAKSEFIELLAGPTKLQLNGVPTDSLKAISVSPYFIDGETIKFVKFPEFDETGTDPTDAKLFVDIATFLESSRRRDEPIQSIIYLHPITHDRRNVADVERNVKMLQYIAEGAIRNIVIVTTKWETIPDSARDSKEADLQSNLLRFYQDPFIRHDGTKWSALSILSNAKRKVPTLLDLGDENPASTNAGTELSDHINALIDSRREQERALEREVRSLRHARTAQEKDKVDQLNRARNEVEKALNRLRNDKLGLDAHIDWEKVDRNSVALEVAVEERRKLATKDWKAEYDGVAGRVAGYDQLVSEIKALRDKVGIPQNIPSSSSGRSYDTLGISIRAIQNYPGYAPDHIWSDWIGFNANDILQTNGHRLSSQWGDVYLVRDKARRVGVAHASYFTPV